MKAKRIERDGGKLEKQYRYLMGDLPVCYRSEPEGKYLYLIDGALSAATADALRVASAWCDEQGCDSVDELKELTGAARTCWLEPPDFSDGRFGGAAAEATSSFANLVRSLSANAESEEEEMDAVISRWLAPFSAGGPSAKLPVQ